MLRKAFLADGTRPGVPILAKATVDDVIRGARDRPDEFGSVDRGGRTDWWVATLALLLRDLAGLTNEEIGEHIGRSGEGARRLVARSRSAMQKDDGYAGAVAKIGHLGIVVTYGAYSQPFRRPTVEVGSRIGRLQPKVVV